MTIFLVRYKGIAEMEADSADAAEQMFDAAADGLMAIGTMSYHLPVPEAEFTDDEGPKQ